VPDTWSDILLTLERASPEPGGFLHSITNPEGLPPVLPDDALYDATVELDRLLRDEGGTVQAVKFRVEWDDEAETWGLTSDYTY
jgi:hypothetical protein